MRDTLREFIDDYNAGRIDVHQLQNRLDFEAWKEEADAAKESARLAVPADYAKRALDPLEILIAEEDTQEKMAMLALLREAIYDVDWLIVVLIARGRTRSDIATAIGTSDATVTRRLTDIAVKAASLGLRERLTPSPSEREAHTPRDKIEYPMDFYHKHEEVENGRKVTRCRVPEYLKECDCDCVCCYCDKCTRKQQNLRSE